MKNVPPPEKPGKELEELIESGVACVRSITDEDTSRNRGAIVRISCGLLRWYKPDGTVKWQSMRQALVKMEAGGHITLTPLPGSQMKYCVYSGNGVPALLGSGVPHGGLYRRTTTLSGRTGNE